MKLNCFLKNQIEKNKDNHGNSVRKKEENIIPPVKPDMQSKILLLGFLFRKTIETPIKVINQEESPAKSACKTGFKL